MRIVRVMFGEKPINVVVKNHTVEFDKDGVAEVPEEIAEVLKQIPGYEVEEVAAPEVVPPVPTKEPEIPVVPVPEETVPVEPIEESSEGDTTVVEPIEESSEGDTTVVEPTEESTEEEVKKTPARRPAPRKPAPKKA